MITKKFTLPDCWKVSSLSEIAESIQYGFTDSAKENKVGPKFLRITDIQNGNVDWNSVPYCEIKDKDIRKYLLTPGDILFARTGATTGKSFLIKNCPEAVFASYLIRIRLSKVVKPEFCYYYFQSSMYWSQIMIEKKGSAQPGVNATILSELKIPVPPIEEQTIIVSKIEELFSRLDAGVAGLKRAQAGLKRYRASVLKAAFEGRLVPQDPNDEPACELLRNNNLKPNEFEKPYSLPDSWVWVKIEDVADTTSGGTPLRSKLEYFGGDIHWIKSGELRDNIINDSDEKITELGLKESSAKIFKKGTTVVALYGATVGKTGILNINAATNQAICAIFPKNNIILNKYLFYWFQYKRQELINLSIGGAQPNISQRIIRSLRFPLSPSKEQARIVVEIERQMSIIENIKNSINNRINNASYLHQAILKSAFSGNLIIKNTKTENY